MTEVDDIHDAGHDEREDLEATEDHVRTLIELGVAESEARVLSVAEAEDLISQIRAEREDAGRGGRV